MNLLSNRILLSLSTIPNAREALNVAGITAATTVLAGLTAAGTGFIDPIQDFHPPRSSSMSSWIKPMSAFLFPSLVEELFWRGMLIPHPSMVVSSSGVNNVVHSILPQAGIVLIFHVLSHPLAGVTVWPRGKNVFWDSRFLLLATIVLGGATASYIGSGGSVWAAAFTHGVPVALW
eukprot:CAMPEP_0178767086 /NCGR_PEP_ID=MMETSP0744-20121128/19436_1 /TAXON_ID=913974 /ORGANISM="Nitzschia punctata, Strain CCMP561" /LENGTH=175 /DNA_ID=CAMNT_0020422903 /DNA_START=145 /DNA_END=669 /DNA_ORIENTATION=+